MHGPLRVALLAAVGCGIFLSSKSIGSETVDRARTLLKKDDPKAAIQVLEAALPNAGADLGPIIVVLRQSYTKASELAKRAGRLEEAEEYRENLQILNRRLREKPEAAVEAPRGEAQKRSEDKAEVGPAVLVPEIDVSVAKASGETLPPLAMNDQPATPPGPLSLTPPSVVPPVQEPKTDRAALGTKVSLPFIPSPSPPQVPSRPSPEALLAKADRHYLAQEYLQASDAYGELAKAELLPDRRRIHWAYCRSVGVMKQIKDEPTTAEEWRNIHAEIAEIKALSPRYWYAEYLRNRAEDQSKAVARLPRKPIIRGAMPETDPKPKAQSDRTPKAGGVSLAVPSTETPAEISSYGDAGNWQIKETDNFVIFHADGDLADRVAQVAEASRDAQTRRWSGSASPRAWSPRCEIYLYPTAAIFAAITKQTATTPGFSTIADDGTRITKRRVNLRADHPSMTNAVLPHEVTHVVLADLFPTKPIPRWADEGIAVLSEPGLEQDRRIGQMASGLHEGKIFSIQKLMEQDYPGGQYWPLYYAQSVSLTRFLVEVGSPGQFIEFLQASQRTDLKTELKRIYQIEGFVELQQRWLEYVRRSEESKK